MCTRYVRTCYYNIWIVVSATSTDRTMCSSSMQSNILAAKRERSRRDNECVGREKAKNETEREHDGVFAGAQIFLRSNWIRSSLIYFSLANTYTYYNEYERISRRITGIVSASRLLSLVCLGFQFVSLLRQFSHKTTRRINCLLGNGITTECQRLVKRESDTVYK